VSAWAEESEARDDSPSIVYRNSAVTASLHTEVPLVRSIELAGEYLNRESVYDGHSQDLLLLWADVFPMNGLSLNATADFENNSGADDGISEDWMGSAEARYDFGGPGDLSHSLTLFAGRLRGGLVCSSGNCRIVAPFRGVKLQYGLQF
jgi:hypothetical protein